MLAEGRYFDKGNGKSEVSRDTKIGDGLVNSDLFVERECASMANLYVL